MRKADTMRKLILLIIAIYLIYPANGIIVVTISDFKPIVKAIVGDKDKVVSLLPRGSDPHEFSLSGKDIELLKKAKLIILANSELFGFEKKISEDFANTIDFKDYDVELEDFANYKKNPHGYWLKPENGLAIANAVRKKLSEIYPQYKDYFNENYRIFVERVKNAEEEARKIAEDVKGKEFVAMVPGVCYIASSLNLKIDYILMTEGAGFVSGKELREIKDKLKSGRIYGILVPEFMKGTKGGEIAESLSKETGCRIAWLKFASGDVDYDTMIISNAARIAYSSPQCRGESGSVYILSILCVAEAAIIFIMRLRE